MTVINFLDARGCSRDTVVPDVKIPLRDESARLVLSGV